LVRGIKFEMVNPEAIGNTNAFFAYIISVKLFKSRWEFRRLLAVVIATVGTFTVIYGGATSGEPPSTDDGLTTTDISLKPTAPLLGNFLTLVASFSYGLYQVLYAIYAALPSDPEVASDPTYEQIPSDDEDETPAGATHIDPAEAVYPPPFGFHPNLLTSLLGFVTLITLWIPIPFLHWSGAEVFRVPPNALTVLSIAGIALSGVVYNAGLMVNISKYEHISTSGLLIFFFL
jgi:drug/metabolite transporter (DMT)-like permease